MTTDLIDALTGEVIDFGIERLVSIDHRIDEHEGAGLRERWEPFTSSA